MQQPGPSFLLMPDVKQEPVSPKYADLTSTTPPPAQASQRYTPSPNPLNPSISPANIPIVGDAMGYIPSISPLQNANIPIQQYQTQSNQNQFNIPNTNMVTATMNFLNQNEQKNVNNILPNNNLDNLNQLDNRINQLDNTQNNNNDNILDNVSGMNISSLLDLDSQQQINTNDLDMISDLLIFGNGSETATNQTNQANTPMTINAIQSNTFDDEEENMTDSFKQFTLQE